MKINKLKNRLKKNRPMTVITLRMPEDVINDLKRIAPKLGISGYQPLIRHYVGNGLREDLERFDDSPVMKLIDGLKRHGVSEETITEVMADIVH